MHAHHEKGIWGCNMSQHLYADCSDLERLRLAIPVYDRRTRSTATFSKSWMGQQGLMTGRALRGVYVCNFTDTVSREHTVPTVSLMTLEIISWNSGISWRRLTNSRSALERRTAEFSDCSSIAFRLRPPGVNGLCGIACFWKVGVPGRKDDCCGVDCRRFRWVPV